MLSLFLSALGAEVAPSFQELGALRDRRAESTRAAERTVYGRSRSND
jgi:hypothetical protein